MFFGCFYFYPRSPCGERRRKGPRCQGLSEFLSTLSLRRATLTNYHFTVILTFLSTLSLRRATGFCDLEPIRNAISIHALLAESDHGFLRGLPKEHLFLSTLSLRRATCGRRVGLPVAGHFYPRSPCGERHTTTITICTASKFLSTLSLRRATDIISIECCSLKISIHALLAESDPRELV